VFLFFQVGVTESLIDLNEMNDSLACITLLSNQNNWNVYLYTFLVKRRNVSTFIAGMIWPKSICSSLLYQQHNSPGDCARELFKHSTDLTSLLVCNEIYFFGFRFFSEWCHKWSSFRPFWTTSSGPGPKLLDGRISLKFLLEIRLKSTSFETLDDLLGFRVQKLWPKNNKIINPLIR